MTSEELFKVLPVLEAMKEGKTIQYRIFENGPWEDVTEAHNIDINSYEYRVKPSEQYRPFKGGNECWKEMFNHVPFGWIKDKYGNALHINGVFESYIRADNDELYYDINCQNFTFADGAPFGIKDDE